MDELDISGKRFISSKRAAKENRYHVDYIGQLIRGGKVVGSKVGRTWYVEAESLATYLGREYKAPTNTLEIKEAAVAEKVFEKKEIEEPVKINVTPTPSVHTYAEVEHTKEITHEPKVPFVPLTYLSDDEPFLPVAKKELHQQIELQKHIEPIQIPKTHPKIAVKKVHARTSKRMVFALAVLGVLTFGAAAGASYLVSYTNTIEGSANTASLSFSGAR